jgi:hypothetical protein
MQVSEACHYIIISLVSGFGIPLLNFVVCLTKLSVTRLLQWRASGVNIWDSTPDRGSNNFFVATAIWQTKAACYDAQTFYKAENSSHHVASHSPH